MPHYFFDVLDRVFVADDVGQDLPDLDAATKMATAAACEIGRDLLEPGKLSVLEVQVRDEAGRRVLTVTLSMTVSES